GGPGPQGVRDPWPRPARPDPDPRLAHGTMAGGDGSEVRPALHGPSYALGLGAASAPDRVDRHGEATRPPDRGPGPALGPCDFDEAHRLRNRFSMNWRFVA